MDKTISDYFSELGKKGARNLWDNLDPIKKKERIKNMVRGRKKWLRAKRKRLKEVDTTAI